MLIIRARGTLHHPHYNERRSLEREREREGPHLPMRLIVVTNWLAKRLSLLLLHHRLLLFNYRLPAHTLPTIQFCSLFPLINPKYKKKLKLAQQEQQQNFVGLPLRGWKGKQQQMPCVCFPPPPLHFYR